MYREFFSGLKGIDEINRFDNIVLGISGGYDSMCMLHMFYRFSQETGINLRVVTINHLIRGKTSYEDMMFVIDYCKKMDISCHPYQIDIPKYCTKGNISVEEGGREVRYRLFNKVRRMYGGKYIAIAQNKNDQVETLLMRFIRGTGIDGLAGIQEVRSDNVIRPIMAFERECIEEYCRKYDLKPRLDETNLKTIYTRNRIRLDIIPYIKKYLNPNLINTVYNNSSIYRDDSDFLNEYSINKYKELVVKKDNNIDISLKKFNGMHISVKRRIIRHVFKEIKGNLKEITSKNIEDIIKLCFRGSNGKYIMLYDVKFSINYDKITINLGSIEDINSYFYNFEENEVFVREANCKLLKGTISSGEIPEYSKSTIFFDIEKLSGVLSIRNRRDGDKFVPLGMKNKKKIKDFFIDKKIPREERNRIPIIVTGEEVLWISGYRIDDRFKVDKDTKKVGYIKIVYLD